MPGIYLSEEEMEALIGAPSLAQRLYMIGIRPTMDYETGQSGLRSKISWHGLARELRVESAPGIKEELPSKSQLRRALQHLVKRGLIVEMSEGLRLILSCPLARLSSHVQKKADTKPTHLEGTESETSKIAGRHTGQGIAANVKDKADTQPDIFEIDKPTHIRVSEISTPPVGAREEEFTMHIGWKPSANFADRLRLTGIDHETIPADQRKLLVGEFVSYWLGQSGRAHRQSQWDHKLIQHITGALRGGRYDEKQVSGSDVRRSGKRKGPDWDDLEWAKDLGGL